MSCSTFGSTAWYLVNIGALGNLLNQEPGLKRGTGLGSFREIRQKASRQTHFFCQPPLLTGVSV